MRMVTCYKFRCLVCGWSALRHRGEYRCPDCGSLYVVRLNALKDLEAEAELDALLELFNEAGEVELAEAEVDEELRLAGYDPEEMVRKFRELVGKLLRDRRRSV